MKQSVARWFGGCMPGQEAVVPVGARLVWADPLLWVVGDWAQDQVRTAEQHGTRIAVLGPCSASAPEMERALISRGLAASASSWAGSFTVVRVDDRGCVEVLADGAGACPLYKVITSRGPVWGSSSLALSPLAGGNVDGEWLAAYLRERNVPASGRSAWSGVEPVPAGCRLTLAPDGATSLSRWWVPVKQSLEVALQTLRWALDEGVRTRVTGGTPVTSDLAGMDSTTVALLAAQRGRVSTMTLYPSGVAEGGDLQYARALDVPGLDRTYFPLEDRHLPFTASDVPLPATDEPAPSTGVWAMFSAQLRTAAAHGSARHLTGDGGDNLFLPGPVHLADLARSGHWVRLVRDAMDWSRLRKQSPMPLLSQALHGDASRMGRRVRPRPAWLNVPVSDPIPGGGNVDTILVASIRNVARAAQADIQLADSLGIELHNPYFDAAVLRAVVSAPATERFSAHRYKPLLADAFADLLPEAHLQRAAKGLFTGDFHRGLRINLPRVLGLTDGRLAAMRVIDPVPLRAAVHAAALGVQTVWPSLLSVLAAEMWLEAVENTPSTRWTTSTAAGAR
ncbi:albusnodin/ikarugamycin family macrolactam cyclase [Streptomyces sp. CMSTAAHL-2]|uniref:albusnodin/ikarugamycin family macrolactam cyclase n=1 Tax=Streptomyces sp. CMSTAAHL-2 TaxID=2904522 RepID=UPI0022B81839|nr:albusnodin/ikarugamycin family macrolactam cyclase [Streptomyces sp. CMSTAAHL-2]